MKFSSESRLWRQSDGKSATQLRGSPDPSLNPKQAAPSRAILPALLPSGQFLGQLQQFTSNLFLNYFTLWANHEIIISSYFTPCFLLVLGIDCVFCPSGPAQALGSISASAGSCTGQQISLSPSQGPAHQPHAEMGLFEFVNKARQS